MEYTRGQIVEITQVAEDDDPRWVGLRCEVADTYIYEIQSMKTFKNTKLIPLSDRPDSEYLDIEPRDWFFWPTDDLKLVEEEDNERQETNG